MHNKNDFQDAYQIYASTISAILSSITSGIETNIMQ